MNRSLFRLIAVGLVLKLAIACDHDQLIKGLELERQAPSATEKQTSSWASIRIKFIYLTNISCQYAGQRINLTLSTSCTTTQPYECKSVDVLTPTKLSYMQSLIDQAATRISSLIKVHPAASVDLTTFSSKMCCATDYSNYVAVYPNYDLVVFVTFNPSVVHSSTYNLAFASACRQDSTGRPIVGSINIGPNVTSTANKDIYTVIHELTHVLGFSSAMFPYAASNSGHQIIGTTTKSDGRNVTMLVSPGVVAAVRSQYSCSTALGAELEDFEGSISSHWETTIFGNEYMTPIRDPIQGALSAVTLAYLQDSGWYQTDQTGADYFYHGFGEGCSFLTDRCNTRSNRYFCSITIGDSGYDGGCSADYKALASCNKIDFGGQTIQISSTLQSTTLPAYYQYFNSTTIGGNNAYANFCPTWGAFSNGLCSDATNAASYSSVLGNVFESSSRCFQSANLQFTNFSGTFTSGAHRCLPTSCGSDGTLNLRFDSVFVPCPTAGGQIDVYQALLTASNTACSDTPNWNYAGYPCSFFGSNGCSRFTDYGQFANCRASCGTCVPYKGTVTCPPASSICLQAASPSPSAQLASLSPSPSRSTTFSASSSVSVSTSALQSVSITPSRSVSFTATKTVSFTPTKSVSFSPTHSVSRSSAVTPSRSVSHSRTPTQSASRSRTASITPTHSLSASKSRTPTVSHSRPGTPSRTPTK